MQTNQPAPAAARQLAQHLLQLVGIEAELAVEVTGADVLVGVALDAGGEAQHQPHRLAQAGGQLAEQLDVAPVVQHHGDAVGGGQGQLLGALVVAVQHDPLGRHAPAQGGEQFARRHGVQTQALLGHQGCDRQGAVGLGGVEGQGGAGIVALQGLAVGAAAGAQGGLIEHIQRCAVGARQLAEGAAPQLQTPLAIEGAAQRRQVAVGAGQVHAGLEGPLAAQAGGLAGDHHDRGRRRGNQRM